MCNKNSNNSQENYLNKIILEKENKIHNLYEKLFTCKEIIIDNRNNLKKKENQIEDLEKINSKLYEKLLEFKQHIENKNTEINLLEHENLKTKEQNLVLYHQLLKYKNIISNDNNKEIINLKKLNDDYVIKISNLEKEIYQLRKNADIQDHNIKVINNNQISSQDYRNLEKIVKESINTKSLNIKQLKAITTTEGFVRIIAGAGSGKTRTLTDRYAYIIEELGISPSNILCVTFTNKSAQEIKKRVKHLLGEGSNLSYITTYHGFCVKVLREDIDKLLFPINFIIMDNQDQISILKEIYNDLGISIKDINYNVIIKKINIMKESGEYIKLIVNPDEKFTLSDKDSISYKIFKCYLKKQRKNFALDFNDLINYTFFLFQNYSNVLEKWQERIHYIQVDETQDSSIKQFSLLDMLSYKHKNLFVVGDPDQTIYEWRGAIPEILTNFDQNYVDTKTIVLDENYRSTPDILNIGNSIIKNNKLRVEKEMFTKNKNGDKAIYFHAKSELEEGKWIAREIKKLQDSGVLLKDIAVLYRANYISRYVEQTLIIEDIKYLVVGGIGFFERKEIKDALSYLRLVLFGDDISFLRVYNTPKRGLGKKFLENLYQIATNENQTLYQTLKNNLFHKDLNIKGAYSLIDLIENSRKKMQEISVSDLLQYILDESGIISQLRQDGDSERLENINELVSSIIFYEKESNESFSLNDYLQEISLYTDTNFKENTNTVKLMTIHTAKGLEFPYVFLCGVSEGILPSFKTLEEYKIRGLEEERRLIYVAITRAIKGLYISESEGFNYNTGNKYPSRFIFEIPKDLIIQKGEVSHEIIQYAQQYISNLTQMMIQNTPKIFNLYEIVVHPVFGKGNIISIDKNKQEYLIKFENFNIAKVINMNFKNLNKY